MTSAAPPASTAGRLPVAVAGASGRMGRMLIAALDASPDLVLGGALDAPSSPALGSDPLQPLGKTSTLRITDDLAAGLAGCLVLIDFTRPEGTLRHLAACRSRGIAVVVGTTGFTPQQKAEIGATAEHVPVVFAPNMSVGVNVVMQLVEQAARALDERYDIEIVEMHHKLKVDAPSGTAIGLGEHAARGRGRTLDEVAVYARHGETGERQSGSIGFAALRGGDVVGDHTVVFAGPGERIEVTHKAASRQGYADGSLQAARFLLQPGRRAGLYDMADVLGFRS